LSPRLNLPIMAEISFLNTIILWLSLTNNISKATTDSQLKLNRMKRTYSLQMQAMAGVILFLVGIFLWYFVGQQGLNKLSHFIELALAAIGAVWYLVSRIRIIANR